MTSSRVGMIHERVFGEGSHARVDILVVDGSAGRRLDAVAIELDGAGAHGLAGRVRLQHGQGFDLGPARAADAPGLLQHPDAAAPMSIEPFRHVVVPSRCQEVGVGYASKEELFATADIVTVHVVLSQRSRGLVGAADLARMKPTSYIVNTARGPIIDEDALLQTLQQKKIAGAAVDVFSVEPLPVDHPFRKLDNLVLTPHLGYVTEESFRNHYSQMVEGIDAWFKGEPLRRLA